MNEDKTPPTQPTVTPPANPKPTTITVTYTLENGKWSAHCNIGDGQFHHLTDELPDLSKLAYKVTKWLKKKFK